MKLLSLKSLAIFGVTCEKLPSRPISLWELMRQIAAAKLIPFCNQLDELVDTFSTRPAHKRLTRKEVEEALFKVSDLLMSGTELRELGWWDVDERLGQLQFILDRRRLLKHTEAEFPGFKAGKAPHPPVHAVYHALYELRVALFNALEGPKFAMIDEKKAEFLEQDEAFGKQVNKAFPSAKNEIRDAANCLALDFNTAAMFHLMRVAELGMRALAAQLNVKPKKNTIDSAGWSEIIKHIGDATAQRWQKLPKAKAARRKAVAFLKLCEISADELNIFKEIWRNNTMHAGLPNSEQEAHGVYIRVRDFMQRLSKQVSEK